MMAYQIGDKVYVPSGLGGVFYGEVVEIDLENDRYRIKIVSPGWTTNADGSQKMHWYESGRVEKRP
jgi:hypothetical protein